MSNPSRTAEHLRRQHGMPRPAVQRQPEPYTRIALDFPATAASPAVPAAPIPPKPEPAPDLIDYAYALCQVQQAEHCAQGILDFLAAAAAITPAATPPDKVARFVDALQAELARIATQLHDLDLHQPFRE